MLSMPTALIAHLPLDLPASVMTLPASLTLGQFGFEGAQFDAVAPAPMHERLLLESPWLLVGVLVVLGAAWWYVQQRRGKGTLGVIGLAVGLLLAGGVYALSEAVETERETLNGLTVDFVEAVAEADPRVVDGLLQQGAWVSALRRIERDEVLGFVERAADRGGQYDVERANFLIEWKRVRSVDSEITGAGIGTSQINLVVQPTGTTTGVPTAMWWEIDWDQQPNGSWQARTVTLLWMAGLGNQLRH